MRTTSSWLSGILLLASLAGLLLAGCGESAEVYSPSGYRETGDPSVSGAVDEGGGGFDGTGGSSSRPGGGGIEPGTLTAGAWDDNLNFNHFEAFLATTAEAGSLPGLPNFSPEERRAAHDRFGGERAAHRRLDVALVIDTTGSMGDEIAYLQTELQAIATEVHTLYPSAETRWALILYRDQGDEYVVRGFDFTTSESELRARLAAQSANGGGDYPEASHAALEESTGLAWREGADTARLLFWVADAPHHQAQTAALSDALRVTSDLDVHVYPVASSGVDLLTEASMRMGAQLTGGRYLFLTDDSGVGGSHLEPTIPCYFVTRLNHAILRMVEIEMSGVYREPEADQVIRTGGDPRDGACTLESGDIVEIF